MDKIYQTIIIGAGTGGLIAGRYLENSLILDKKQEIGRPVRSGEGISCQALAKQGIEPDSQWISASIDTIQRIVPNGRIFGGKKKNLGYILNKAGFEKFLARQSKAEIKLNTEVADLEKSEKDNLWLVKTKNGEVFKAKYLIGADGAFSIVRQKIFNEKIEFVPAIQYLVELEKEIEISVAKIYLDNEKFPQGYAWIFPKGKKLANIGLGGEGNLDEKMKDFLKEIVEKEYGSYKLLQNKSGIISFGRIGSIFKDNAFLIGDAAGLADPIFKGGISQSMESARIAAQSILNNEAELYEQKIKAMPFADPRLLKAKEIFCSLSNETFNELGEVLEGKGTSYFKTPAGIIKFLSKPHLRKDIFRILKFFSIWWPLRDHLW